MRDHHHPGHAPDDSSVRRLARRAGLPGRAAPSFEEVERRRSQLRAVVFVVVASLGATVVVLAGSSTEEVAAA